MEQKKYELEDRFIDLASGLAGIVDVLPDTTTGNFLSGQLMNALLSPTLIYGEAQNAASRNEFIQKMAGIMKELKTCRVALKVIRQKEMIKPAAKLEAVYAEIEHLVAIVGKSISTAKKNKTKNAAVEN
jgi:four helix bundle protein